MSYETERRVALEAVALACRVCRAVQADLVRELAKEDKSPVTVADFGAQAVVGHMLQQAFPTDPLVGEEDASDLRKPENTGIRAAVLRHVRTALGDLSEATILEAIDRGTYEGGATGRHWTLDPIDGTKGFLRRDQYAVALALIEKGEVVLGVLGCPSLPVDARVPEGPAGCLFVAVRGEGAAMIVLDADTGEIPIRVSRVADTPLATFCESVEKGHTSQSDSARVASLLGITVPPFRIDSQCKYAAVGRADADVYLRLPTRKDYEEKIWDHAAGCIVITEAGGRVTDVRGKDLDFSLGRTLRENKGVVVTNGPLHDAVLRAVGEVLGG